MNISEIQWSVSDKEDARGNLSEGIVPNSQYHFVGTDFLKKPIF